MKSDDLKAIGVAFLRFYKQHHIIATESGLFSSDVLGTNERGLIELEIKCSYSDFKADFLKEKHLYYNNKIILEDLTPYRARNARALLRHVPNHFIFLVDASIADKCLEYLKNSEYSKYGLACNINDKSRSYKNIKILIKPKKLRAEPVDDDAILVLLKRMSSQLANFIAKHKLN